MEGKGRKEKRDGGEEGKDRERKEVGRRKGIRKWGWKEEETDKWRKRRRKTQKEQR